jgi:hypothetical protein
VCVRVSLVSPGLQTDRVACGNSNCKCSDLSSLRNLELQLLDSCALQSVYTVSTLMI